MINTSVSFIFHIAKSVRETDKRRTYPHKSITGKICLNERHFPEQDKLGTFFFFVFYYYIFLLNIAENIF